LTAKWSSFSKAGGRGHITRMQAVLRAYRDATFRDAKRLRSSFVRSIFPTTLTELATTVHRYKARIHAGEEVL
jgi:hypothetical protein